MEHTLSRQVLGYLEGLTLSGGDHDGSPFTILPWERRFVRGVFSRSGNAAVTVGRGNGKSAVVAGIASAVVDPEGPLTGNRREVVVSAASFEQSRVIFEDVVGFLEAAQYDLTDRTEWRKQDSANRAWLECRATKARVRCIGSDPATAHGLRPYLVLADEPAQWEAAKRDRMLAALETGLGKVPGSRLIALGTRAATPGHWFSRMLAGNGASYTQVHAARPDDPPFRVATWRRANPSIDHLPSLMAKIAEEAATARRDPELLQAFRALRLNLGVADTEQAFLMEAERWAELEGDQPPDGRPCWGIDLGTNAAASAIAAYWPATGRLEVVSAFPREPSLSERGLRDGVGRLYTEATERGELIQAGGAAVDVGELVAEARQRFGPPEAIACDRWRESELRDTIKAVGLPLAELELRGQGFKDGAQDVRTFRRACAEGVVTPLPSLFLSYAVSQARTVSDPAGNAKLAKGSEGGRRQLARDDAAAAAILAVSLGRRRPARPSGAYLGAIS